MNPHDPISPETQELLDAWFAGDADEAQLKKLAELLAADSPRSRQIGQAVLDGGLIAGLVRSEDDFFIPETLAALRIQQNDSRFLLATADRARAISLPDRAHSRRASRRRVRQSSTLSWIGLAAAALAVAVLLILALRDRSQPVVSTPPAPAPRVEPTDLNAARGRAAHAEAEEQRLREKLGDLARETGAITGTDDAERREALIRLGAARRAAETELAQAVERRVQAQGEIDAAVARETTARPPVPAPSLPGEVARVMFVHPSQPVSVRRNGAAQPLRIGATLLAGDRIETAAGDPRQAHAALALNSGGEIDVAEKTLLDLTSPKSIRLQRGLLYASVEPDTSATGLTEKAVRLTLTTPDAGLEITGTRFDLAADGGQTRVRMEEGSVRFFNALGTRTVSALQSSVAKTDQAPSEPAIIRADEVWRGRAGGIGEVVLTMSFGPPEAPRPRGVKNDAGLRFDAARGHGWVDGATVGARLRRAPQVDPLRAASCWVGSASRGDQWICALPNGRYLISLSVGDAEFPQGPHYVAVKGVKLVDDVMTEAGAYFDVHDQPVTVTDGMLRLDVAGSGSTKRSIDGTSDTTLNFIIVKRAR